jgi:CO dehydrogenase maturation factor
MIENPRKARNLHQRPMREVIAELVSHGNDGFDLLTMGRAEAKGCFCGVNDLLRHGVQSLCSDYDVTLIDCEAGIEQVNRRAVHRIDTLILVTDTSRRGFEAVVQVRDLAVKYNEGKPLESHVVVNRIRDEDERAKVRALAHTHALLNVIEVSEDPVLRSANLDGDPLLGIADRSAAAGELRALADAIIGAPPGAEQR